MHMGNETDRPPVLDTEVGFATAGDLPSWMRLAELVREDFPGLETEESMDRYRESVVGHIARNGALRAKADDRVVGVLLFSADPATLDCLAVHPDFRAMGVATRLVRRMLELLPADRDVTVTTYRAGDGKGRAARAFYRKLGFVEGETCEEFGHPVQRFTLRRAGREAAG
jgi:ribosomal protein S18 acetylase RimI-like enzyme